MAFLRAYNITATGTATIGGTDSNTTLGFVNVNTGATSAVLTLKNGSSTGTEIAKIDASAACTRAFFSIHPNGVYVDLSGGNADVTITYA